MRRIYIEAFLWCAAELVMVAWLYVGWTIAHG